ncbi:MAG: hypothetical protein EA348_07610 [Pseudomonadaceae bacterium]|nr:MAG: hypothetical protein EA348_07610 [Pseudomonadaceae bacterium]
MRWWKNKRGKPRCYAKLDTQGHCLALWRLDMRPEGRHWVEVKDMDTRQIGLAADQLTPVNGNNQAYRGAQQQAQRAPACSRMAT